jgi:hypothetical protein
MKKHIEKDILSVIIVTAYLILYCAFLNYDKTLNAALLMLFFSPVMIIWMVYTIIKKGKYNGHGLGDEEFGYQDRDKKDLEIF